MHPSMPACTYYAAPKLKRKSLYKIETIVSLFKQNAECIPIVFTETKWDVQNAWCIQISHLFLYAWASSIPSLFVIAFCISFRSIHGI